MSIDPRKLDWPLPASDLDGDPAETHVGESVFALSEEAARLLRPVAPLLTDAFIDLTAYVWDDTPSPTHSLQHLTSLLGRLEPEDRPAFARACLEHRRRFRAMFRLMGVSDMAGDELARGGWRSFLADTEEALGGELARDGLVAQLESRTVEHSTLDEFAVDLRLWHGQAMTRIIHHDCGLGWPVEQVTRELSTLASAALEGALRLATRALSSKLGEPVNADGQPIGVTIFGFGKLGGGELNYSSDIDIMVVYAEEGRTRNGLRPLDASTAFARITEAVIKLLSAHHALGRPYRVDTRLRPDGAQGAVAQSLSSTLRYYHERGNTWERQALLKIRPVAGDMALGARFMESIRPFVHRRYLTVRAINEIKALKRRIEHRTESNNETYRDVKTGFGGIRDIEFVTQFLQLLNGGRYPVLQTPNTLEALDALARCGCLQPQESNDLASAYRLLRRVEHGLQLDRGLQTHRLPDDEDRLELLARRLGYSHREGARSPARRLYHDLAAATIHTRGLLLRLFTSLFDADEGVHDAAELALDPAMDAERAVPILSKYGLRDPAHAWTLIGAMMRESDAFRALEARTRTYLASMLPSLLGFVASTPDPDSTLANFERLTDSMGAKRVFYELVAQRPDALRLFGALCAQSRFLVDLMDSRPGLLDEFVDVMRTVRVHDRAALRAELDARCLAASDFVSGARASRALELLRIGTFDISGRSDITVTMRDLGVLADVVVEAALAHSIASQLGRFPALRSRAADVSRGMVVLALGKHGSSLLNYLSDLDLVFLHDSLAAGPALESDMRLLAERVAHEMRRLLSSGLYQVDLRLRPQGSKGEIATSLAALEQYLDDGAAFWERLALTRGRIVANAGTPAAARVEELVARFVYERPLPVDALEQTREMRQRMADAVPSSHLKRGRGGLLDYEFAVEWLQLLHGRSGSNDTRSADPSTALASLVRAGHADAALADAAERAYRLLRMIENRMQLSLANGGPALPESAVEREILARRLGWATERELTDRVAAARATLQDWMASVLS